MEFTIEFYELPSGRRPVLGFLDELKATDPGDFAAVMAGEKHPMKRKNNFDRYLETQLEDPDFAERFRKAGEAWDVALQLTVLRKRAGLSQKELAQKVGTSQQQISRLESTSYEGHSLSMLRRVAGILGAEVHVEIRPVDRTQLTAVVAGKPASYGKIIRKE